MDEALEVEAIEDDIEAPEEDRTPSRRSFYEEDKAELSMVAAELQEADKFNLTIEYVDKPMIADDEDSGPGSTKSSDECDTESSDEKIELEADETKISPASISVASLKKPIDKRKSLATELLSDWKTPAKKTTAKVTTSRKRESQEVGQTTPKRKVLTERRSLNL